MSEKYRKVDELEVEIQWARFFNNEDPMGINKRAFLDWIMGLVSDGGIVREDVCVENWKKICGMDGDFNKLLGNWIEDYCVMELLDKNRGGLSIKKGYEKVIRRRTIQFGKGLDGKLIDGETMNLSKLYKNIQIFIDFCSMGSRGLPVKGCRHTFPTEPVDGWIAYFIDD